MAIFVSNENVIKDQSYGQVINRLKREFIEPELKKRGLNSFTSALIEVSNSENKVYLDDFQVSIKFKQPKLNPDDIGKQVSVDLKEIEDIGWHDNRLEKNSAKILVIHFNKDWWMLKADLKNHEQLEEKFQTTKTFTVRGGGYMPLQFRKQEKDEFVKNWGESLQHELPDMWRRHLTASQRYRGVMVYDGNYFDLFNHAEELFVLGFHYSSIIICRTAAEQALIRILIKSGKPFDIYKKVRSKEKLKSIESLVETCRSYSLFHGKYPINKTSAKKLNEIATIAGDLVHPKYDLYEMEQYKKLAIKCMDNLYYVMQRHLNFIKDTGVVSGYKLLVKSARRLR